MLEDEYDMLALLVVLPLFSLLIPVDSSMCSALLVKPRLIPGELGNGRWDGRWCSVSAPFPPVFESNSSSMFIVLFTDETWVVVGEFEESFSMAG